MMRKVLVGGVFNIVHPGHVFFLKKAKELGDYLVVVIANDKTAARTKQYAVRGQEERKRDVEKLGIANKVVIGDASDFMKVVREEKPDIIALGYDQRMNEYELKWMLAQSGVRCAIFRIKQNLRGYKTSRLIKKNKK